MASPPFNPAVPLRRDWAAAWRALRRLLADSHDTVQVFRITRALNGDIWQRNYRRLIASPEGGRLAYRRVELSRLLSDRSWIDLFPEGSVGAGYRAFLERTGYSATGMIEVSVALETYPAEVEHPYAWFRRRERDLHDVWHVLTGYRTDEPLGEACLVAFTYGQTGGLGWAFIAAGAALRSLRITRETAFARAVWEAWRNGRRSAWLHGEDYEALMEEPIESARRRLRIAEPVRYRRAKARLAAAGQTGF
jgi:ubiquinone biosynthesis protein COQ4